MTHTLPTLTSRLPVAATSDRLAARIEREGWHLFARIDHADLAHKAGMELRPTVLLLLGNPQIGTRLMQDRQTAAIDLPVKILVWEDAHGTVFVRPQDLDELRQRHGITDDATLATIRGVLERVCAAATA